MCYSNSTVSIVAWLYTMYVYCILTCFIFHAGCNCSSEGSNNPEECDRNGGQCSCKPGVIGQTCDQCRPDYFNFSSGQGCQGKVVIRFGLFVRTLKFPLKEWNQYPWN